MKKMMVLFLVFSLLLPVSSMAAEVFSFRNGYHWGMSMEEAIALGAEESIVFVEEGGPALVAKDVPVGEMAASEMTLVFPSPDVLFSETEVPLPATADHILKRIGYMFPPQPKDSPEDLALRQYLVETFTEAYGTPQDESDEYTISYLWDLDDTYMYLTGSWQMNASADEDLFVYEFGCYYHKTSD